MTGTAATATKEWTFPGARWWRFDFHTHTPASHDTYWAKDGVDLAPEQWLQRFMDAGIDCVAVTDHNSGDWIDRLNAAYARMEEDPPEDFRKLCLFPGVELSVNGGFHLLAIFDTRTTTADIDSLRGDVGYSGNKGDSDGVTRKSVVEVIEAVHRAGGLAIPAHVDQPKGLLHQENAAEDGSPRLVPDPNTLRQVFESDHVLAMEVVDRDRPRPALYTERRLAWSEVVGSDCHSFQGRNAPGSRYTWVKMAEPSLDGLRLALLDGEGFSLKRSDEVDPNSTPNALPEHFLESVEIAETRFMGRSRPETLSFSPWFNALVGGRGTGKSTIVHALRLALRRDQELDALEEGSEARHTFQRFTRPSRSRDDEGVLRSESRIALTFVRGDSRYRVHWNPDGVGVVVEEAVDGEWRESDHQAVIPSRFPVRLFSQGQIAALAGGSQQALLDLIDEAAGVRDEKSALHEARQAYLSLRARARELEGRLRGRDELKVHLEDVRRKLDKFEEAHHAEVLKAYQRRSRQEREVTRQMDTVDAMVARIRGLADELAAEDLPEGLFDAENAPDAEARAAVSRLHQAVEAAASALKGSAGDLENSLDRERQALSRSGWQQAVNEARANYEKLTGDLQEQGVADPGQYGQLVQERQRLETEWNELQALEAQRNEILEQAESQLRALQDARRALSHKREAFLQDSLAENPYVRIRLRPYAQDYRGLERGVRELLGAERGKFESDILVVDDEGRPSGGVVAELLESLPDDHERAGEELEQRLSDLKNRLLAASQGQGGVGGHFKNFLTRQASSREEFADHLMAWFPEDGLSVQYSQKGDGNNFRAIEQASAGQRAAAMLAFLLAHGSEPIVLDQPEDDLDNHLIYDLVVRQMRENKLRRQIIAVTHNPNIVVNGDAEMIHALDFRGGQCRVTVRGSLQDKDMRDEVCQIMEGGRDAFERRYRRLGREA